VSTPDRPDVIVVGDLMIDVSVAAGALVRGGDVRGEVRLRPGGTAGNAAVWAAVRGASTVVVGRVGDDLPGTMIAAALRERGVKTALTIDPAASTGTMLVVHQGSERSMVADRGANACLSPEDLPRELTGRAVLVSGYLLFDAGSEAAALAALARAQAETIAVESGSWPLLEAYGAQRFLAATSRATLLLANEPEAEVLFGREAVADPARLKSPYRWVCVKRGRRGALLVSHEEVIEVASSAAHRPMDPTGAGDAFDGVLLAALTDGTDARTALAEACAAGAEAAMSSETWPAPLPGSAAP
jgi:ribokinase